MTTRRRSGVLAVIALALLLGGVVAHWASSQPDGLEAVAARQHFDRPEQALLPAPAPDYELPWLRTVWGRTLVGVGGVLLTLGVTWGLGRLLSRRRQAVPQTTPTEPTD